MQNGHHLAALVAHYRNYRDAYLAWVADRGYEPSLALPNYRRALVAWYEASIDSVDAYAGEPYQYITAVAGVYYGAPPAESAAFLGGNPLDYLPETIRLDDDGKLLLNSLDQAGTCKELMLLSDYHRLDPTALQRVFEGNLAELSRRIDDCRQGIGAPSPDAPRWKSVVTIAGRLDLIHTLEREETPTVATVPTPVPEVAISRRKSDHNLPSPAIILAGLLFGILLWLLYDTFNGRSPERLFAEYFSPYPNVFATSPPLTDIDRDLQRILEDYDRGDYRTAYDELLPTADHYPASPLYLGVCALALGDHIRARQWLARIQADSPYRDAAEWYDALAALDSGADAGANISLERIADASGHPYRDRARQLLSDL